MQAQANVIARSPQAMSCPLARIFSWNAARLAASVSCVSYVTDTQATVVMTITTMS